MSMSNNNTPLEPPVADINTDRPSGHPWITGDDVATCTVSTNSSTNSRPYTPSDDGGVPPSAAFDTTEATAADDDASEAGSASARYPAAMSSPPDAVPLRRKYGRHVSRSAAKRDSVMALPSIQTLRAHFGGAAASHRSGHGAGIRLGDTLMEDDEDAAAVASLGLGRPPPRKPWNDVKLARVAPADARAEAGELANAMRRRWAIHRGEPDSLVSLPTTSEDVRSVFVETARAVRRVRTLGLSLAPSGGAGLRRVSGPPKNGPAFSTPSRPAKPQPRLSSGPIGAAANVPEPTAPVRRAALDLLGSLRMLEERVRAKHNAPTVVIIPDGDSALVASPVDEQHSLATAFERSSSASPPQDVRRLSISSPRPSTSSLEDSLFSDDEDWNINAMAREAETDERPHEPWEVRLVSEDREYETLADGQWTDESRAVREAARTWADAVDRVFGARESRPVISWVTAEGSEMDRVRAFLAAHLTREHVALLPTSEDALLTRLSDGYLLIQAYNAVVHSSHRPWGFVADEDVHDTLRGASASPPAAAAADGDGDESADSTKDLREWTFRRVGNLTAWAAAVKLRYNLAIVLPHSAVLAPPTLPDGKPIPRAVSAPVRKKRDSLNIDFDPLLVAKREAEGESMLRNVLLMWVAEATREVECEREGNGATGATGAEREARQGLEHEAQQKADTTPDDTTETTTTDTA